MASPAGNQVVKESSDPAAGAECSLTFEDDAILKSFKVSLVTGSDSGADAQVNFIFKDADGDEYYRAVAGGTQAESLTRGYIGKPGDIDNPAVADGFFIVYLPKAGVPVFRNGTLTTSTTGLHAADNFGILRATIERFDL